MFFLVFMQLPRYHELISRIELKKVTYTVVNSQPCSVLQVDIKYQYIGEGLVTQSQIFGLAEVLSLVIVRMQINLIILSSHTMELNSVES